MIRFFTEHPTASNLMMVLFLLAGILTFGQIKRETFPEVKSFEVEVKVVYPGATPLDVELSICKPIEDALDGISFTEEKRCQARNSLGLMTVKMLESGDFDEFQDDIKSAVDAIDNFPDTAELPIITELGRTQSVVTLAVTADIPATELKTLAEQIKQRMLQNQQIPLVDIEGFSERQFQVQISQHNLRQYGLSIQDIANTLQKQNLDLPAGDINTQHRDYQIRFNDEKRSVEALEELVIIQGKLATEVRLKDIATIIDGFEEKENKVTYNNEPAAFLKVSKNTQDDSLNILSAVQEFIAKEQASLPSGVGLYLTQDYTSIVQDRISMLGNNALQGLLLVFLVMWLFFGTRYAFWVVMGLPVSFFASAFILGNMGVSINMLSMVALLLALGILMDDAIVISESIGHQIRHGKKPLEAAIDGTKLVARGVFSSFLTTLCIFSGLVFLQGDIGQVLKVIPVVLISVICVSLFEAFFILPSHLHHSLVKAQKKTASQFRIKFDAGFEQVRLKIDQIVNRLIHYRYLFLGSVIALLILSVGLLSAGVVKFSPFPNVEGDMVQARILMPTGTSLENTEKVVAQYQAALKMLNKTFSEETRSGENLPAIESVTVNYNQNADANETGAHLATISVDLLSAEIRHFSTNDFINTWREQAGDVPQAWNINIKEPSIGPSGRAIEIRLQGEDLQELASASHALQSWLAGYPGVYNLLDDLRPGKPEFTLHLKPGAFSLGLDAQTIASQLRAAYQGAKIIESSIALETYEVSVILNDESKDELADFDSFPIIHPTTGAVIPLSHVANIEQTRSYSRIHRIDNLRTVSIYGDIDSNLNNTGEVINDVKRTFLTTFADTYPEVTISFQGEVKEGGKTQGSMGTAFILGLAGVFILLSFQFRSYAEPLIVMLNIPLAFIGVVFGHLVMGMDITMPSLLGFVSLAGIVVNDSILLVEFVKRRVAQGLSVHNAAAKASHDRFRAVLLTSLTTIAGMTPLLFESSLQAQVLIPLATSIVFGIASSTLLVLFVVPCFYTILEDFGIAQSGSTIKGAV